MKDMKKISGWISLWLFMVQALASASARQRTSVLQILQSSGLRSVAKTAALQPPIAADAWRVLARDLQLTLRMLVHRSPLAETVIGAAIEVHRTVGPGLLESAYRECLAFELAARGVKFVREAPLPLTYKGTGLDCGYRIDFLVEQSLLVELKAVERMLPIHSAQTLTYLKLLGVRQALLFNFNVRRLTQGLKSFLL
jgi:GxxExxY protein